jgi:ABC-type multidrug transport system ATPase subunit
MAMASSWWRTREPVDASCAMPIALRVRALWKSYAAGVAGCSARVWVLRGTNLDVERGECVAVLGAHGAGTTTLLHCLAGLRLPDAGSVEREAIPLLVDPHDIERAQHADARLLLVDDRFDPRHRTTSPRIAREARARSSTIVIATHELARVRDVADRVLLLHHGGLFPLDHPTEARRVAERPGMALVTD